MKIDRPIWLQLGWIAFYVLVLLVAALYAAFFAGFLSSKSLAMVSGLGVIMIGLGGFLQWRTNLLFEAVRSRARAASGNLCPCCHYPMTVAIGETCPECGTKIDQALLFRWQLWWRGAGRPTK